MRTYARYEIRLEGAVPANVLRGIDLVSRVSTTEQTVLILDEGDPARLGGVLQRLDSLGLSVVEYRQIPSEQRGGAR
jgi:hypothetical protein